MTKLPLKIDAPNMELPMTHVAATAAVMPPLAGAPRHDWTREEICALFALPFPDLIFGAQRIHRMNFDPAEVQISTLLSIKTGGCPEDCAYCPQSRALRHRGQSREADGCRGGAGRSARRESGGRDALLHGRGVALAERSRSRQCLRDGRGRESARAGSLRHARHAHGAAGAAPASDAGLDYYNHNLDTSPEYYDEIITTRTFQDRLDTLDHVRDAGITVCCGGIVGMGERRARPRRHARDARDVAGHPESVPINALVPVEARRWKRGSNSTRSISCA